MIRRATFSRDRIYRYSLFRTWDADRDPIAFIGLNSSTADEWVDDNTIRRCIGFGRDWDYGGIVMLNAFAYRATDPRVMRGQDEPVGPDNDNVIQFWSKLVRQVVICWGVHGSHRQRSAAVKEMLFDVPLFCFGTTKSGEPKHPLYLSSDSKLVSWP